MTIILYPEEGLSHNENDAKKAARGGSRSKVRKSYYFFSSLYLASFPARENLSGQPESPNSRWMPFSK